MKIFFYNSKYSHLYILVYLLLLDFVFNIKIVWSGYRRIEFSEYFSSPYYNINSMSNKRFVIIFYRDLILFKFCSLICNNNY